MFANSFVTVLGVGITASTFGYGALTVQNQKTWVDARITIAQSGANRVGNAHTFTVTVQKNNGSGFVAAAGVNVTPSISGLAAASITGGTCGSGPTNASGQCTMIVNSTTVGTATVNASATVNVAGGVGSANVDVATNGYGAFNISNQKTWVDARISITPSRDEQGQRRAHLHRQGGEERRHRLDAGRRDADLLLGVRGRRDHGRHLRCACDRPDERDAVSAR